MSAKRSESAKPSIPLPSLPAEGDLVQGRYRVLHELGRGGMGIVVGARDERLQREVALKVVLPKMMGSAEAIERFINEARSLAQVDSRHVVRVMDCGTINEPAASAGLPFMVLELLRGEDLFSIVARAGTLPVAQVVRLGLDACAGLAAAHSRGIVHRDLKPENLFLAVESDGTQCLKILDFGIARSHAQRRLTRGKLGVGSPGYMSPEQVEGSGSVDCRSDVWGLGVVLYELLANRPAFAAEEPRQLCLQILTTDATPLSELRSDLPLGLVQVVERCLQRDPARRFANVAELAEALAPLAEPLPSSAAVVGIRHQFEVDDERSGLRPLPRAASFASAEPAPPPPRGPSRLRRGLSLFAAALVLLPALALLPRVAQAPELAPARAWSVATLGRVKAAWQAARSRAHELWRQAPASRPAPREP